MKLHKWAAREGVQYQTAWWWWRDGNLPVPARQAATALAVQGRGLIVAGPGETTGDLVRGMIEVLTSVCARLYGGRGAGNRAMRAVAAANNAEMGAAG